MVWFWWLVAFNSVFKFVCLFCLWCCIYVWLYKLLLFVIFVIAVVVYFVFELFGWFVFRLIGNLVWLLVWVAACGVVCLWEFGCLVWFKIVCANCCVLDCWCLCEWFAWVGFVCGWCLRFVVRLRWWLCIFSVVWIFVWF